MYLVWEMYMYENGGKKGRIQSEEQNLLWWSVLCRKY